MNTKYSEFLFQTLYMLINNSKEEYGTLFAKIAKSYDEDLQFYVYEAIYE